MIGLKQQQSRTSLRYHENLAQWDKIASVRFTSTSERDTETRNELTEIRALPAKSNITAEELWPEKSVKDDLEPAAYQQLNDFSEDGKKFKDGRTPASPTYIRTESELSKHQV